MESEVPGTSIPLLSGLRLTDRSAGLFIISVECDDMSQHVLYGFIGWRLEVGKHSIRLCVSENKCFSRIKLNCVDVLMS